LPTFNVTVTSTATVLYTPPSGNIALEIQNLSNPGGTGPQNVTVYLGPNSSVTTSNGWPLPPGSVSSTYNYGAMTTIPTLYAIAPSGQTAVLSVNATTY
jgi:hypothetical protein